MLDIIKLQPGDENFYMFENFAREIYDKEGQAFGVSQPFDKEHLEACFILILDKKVKCRCALYTNPHLNYKGQKSACIGSYESEANKDIASALLHYVSAEAKKTGAFFLIGPMNGSTWNDYRFSSNNNHPPFFMEPSHHLYYNEQFLENGFKVIGKYFSSIETDLKFDNPYVAERQNQFIQSGVSFRNIDITKFEEELEKIFLFNAIAFKSNFLYTPISKTTFIKKYEQTRKLINPEFVIIAEDDKENVIGYIFCVDDFYNKKEKSLIVKTVARHPGKKWSGIGHVLGKMIFEKAMENKYKSIIHSFMYEEGTSTVMSKNFSGNIYKNYVLYGKEL
ncbi:MAG: hypothetical protein ABIN25_10410 [Ginsengibacter sp.]